MRCQDRPHQLLQLLQCKLHHTFALQHKPTFCVRAVWSQCRTDDMITISELCCLLSHVSPHYASVCNPFDRLDCWWNLMRRHKGLFDSVRAETWFRIFIYAQKYTNWYWCNVVIVSLIINKLAWPGDFAVNFLNIYTGHPAQPLAGAGGVSCSDDT